MEKNGIMEMDTNQRLSYAQAKTKYHGRMVLQNIYDGYKFSLEDDSKTFKQWFRVTLNMYAMRGIVWMSRYNLLM